MAYRLAKDIGVPVTRVQAIIDERRGISGDSELRLELEGAKPRDSSKEPPG